MTIVDGMASSASGSGTREAASQADFTALIAPVLDLAYRTALHLTRNPLDAEDVVQEASLRAFRAFHTFQQGTNFKAWFLRILTNQFLQGYRKQRREPELVDVEDVEALYLYAKTRGAGLHSVTPDPAHLLMSKLDQEQVSAALAALPDEYRTVSVLYFMEELSYQEIADMVGCPVGTVRSRLHRGRKLLQKALWRVAEEAGIPAALHGAAKGEANQQVYV
jgi:RNA polymerase sigma-70 factor (ECF subfamily)